MSYLLLLIALSITLCYGTGNTCYTQGVSCTLADASGFLKTSNNLQYAASAIQCGSSGWDVVSTLHSNCGGSWSFVNYNSDFLWFYDYEVYSGSTSAICTCGSDTVLLIHQGGSPLNSACTGELLGCIAEA